MSKVKIQGNASGTGVVTLTAPNTNTDRTITLPDEDITLGGGVDGIVSTANATAITIDSSEHTDFTGGGSGRYGVYEDVASFKGNTYSFVEVRGTNSQSGVLLNKDDSTGYGVLIDNGGHLKLGPLASINQAGLTSLKDSHGTSGLRITSDGRGLSQFTAKAWIHISNNSTINDSHNISSLSDMTTGRMKIYFTNNPGGSNYSISAITSKNGGGASSSNFGKVCIPEDKYSSYFQLFTQLGTSNTDTVYTSAVIFGD